MGLSPPGEGEYSLLVGNACHALSEKLALTTMCCKRQSTCKMAALPTRHLHKKTKIQR